MSRAATLAATLAVTPTPALVQAIRATAATTQAPQLRTPRATSQALMPTGSLAMSRAVTLAVTHPTPAVSQATRAMAAATLVVA